jgi:membrane protein required for colicin V production
MTLAQIISFMAIWIVVPVFIWYVGMFLTKTMDVILLGWVNKSLGAALGLLKNLILLMLLISILEFIDTSNHLISQT